MKTNHALWRLGRGSGADEFARQFGHRAGSSWELFSPRWRDDQMSSRFWPWLRLSEDPARMASQQAERAQQAALRWEALGLLLV